MGKVDFNRDYYADLELDPGTADNNDVKRQFRLLALKFHPDRNPGKEVEFNAKFQAIQAAHELLSDPEQKAKYDTYRSRQDTPQGKFNSYTSPTATGPGSGHGPQRPGPQMPPRTPFTNFPPPPPRRTPAQSASKPDYMKSPPPKSPRYPSTRNPPSDYHVWTSSGEDTKAKSNTFKAWEQMKGGHSSTRNPPNTPKAARPNVWPNPSNGQVPKDGTPKSGPKWEHFHEAYSGPPGMSRSHSTRPPSKGAFAPETPGEAQQARNSAYFNVSRGQRPRETSQAQAQPPPPAQNHPPTAKHPEHPHRTETYRSGPHKPDSGNFKSHLGGDDLFATINRVSTPYATQGGERTYFSSEGLGRSTSNVSNNYSNKSTLGTGRPQSPRRSSRHRSASPQLRSPRSQNSINSTSSSCSSDDEGIKPSRSQFARRASSDNRSSAHAQKGARSDAYHSPKSAQTGNVLSPEGARPKHRSTWDSSGANEAQKTPRQYAASQPVSRQGSSGSDQAEGVQNQRVRRDAEREPMPRSPLHTTSPWNSQDIQKPLEKSKSWHEKNGSKEQGNDQRQFEQPGTDDTNNGTPAFRFRDVPSAPSSPFKSQSSENINSKFSPSDWNGKFGPKVEEYLVPPSRKNTSNGRTSPTKGRSSPFKAKFQMHLPRRELSNSSADSVSTKPTGDERKPLRTSVDETPQTSGPTIFSQEQWKQTFKEATWAIPPPIIQSPRVGSTKRAKSPRKMSTANRRPAIPRPAFVATALNSDGDEEFASNEASSALESDVDRSSGDGSAMDIDSGPTQVPPAGTTAQQAVNKDPPGDIIRSAIPPAAAEQSTQSNGNVDASHLHLSDLKNTVPFTSNNDGLKDLTEIGATLPFESRSSLTPGEPIVPHHLTLPNPPKAPLAPAHINQSTLRDYIASMRAYMQEWNSFNGSMLAHFNERQNIAENKLPHDWLGSSGWGGFARYTQGVEEDVRVREHWDVSWEKHRGCMQSLGKVREKALKGQVTA